jgi:Methyltransferase domain
MTGSPDVELLSEPTGRVTAFLDEVGFAAQIEASRKRGYAPYEPWPVAVGEPGLASAADPVVRLLHGTSTDADRVTAEPETAVGDELRSLELVADTAPLKPGRWEITAFNGVYAVRDRAAVSGHGEVYIGEDGLRFVDAIQRIGPIGDALEVGCGSGLVSAALARTCDSVLGIDVVPPCVDASRVTAVLNGVANKVSFRADDLLTADFSDRFDCVVANLPGEPSWRAGTGRGAVLASRRRRTRRAAADPDPARPSAVLDPAVCQCLPGSGASDALPVFRG